MTRAERAASVATMRKLAGAYRLNVRRERRGMHVDRGFRYALHFSLRSAADHLRRGRAS